mgnify:FL=1
MNHVVLLTHGEFSKGIAQSCEFILGDVPDLKALSITMETSMEQAADMLREAVESFGNQKVIVVTDMAAGSTTQAALRIIPEYENVYLLTGLNLGLLIGLLMTDLTDQKEENIKLLKSIAAQAKDTILFLNDMDEQKFPDQDGEL